MTREGGLSAKCMCGEHPRVTSQKGDIANMGLGSDRSAPAAAPT